MRPRLAVCDLRVYLWRGHRPTMLVYGDPQHWEAWSFALGRIARCVSGLDACSERERLERLRGALIFAGQLEQAVLDDVGQEAGPARVASGAAGALLASLARGFVASWGRLNEPRLAAPQPTEDELGAVLEALSQLPDRRLRVKTPEGFAFYRLYPEQFIEAALDWHAARPRGDAAVLVVGIRSIGTTLAAVVRAVLQALGMRAQATSVRPTGHPFAREVQLAAELHGAERWALVVDEGPGLSGSSMAAVAHALERAGLARGAIAFLPGHEGMPGHAASEAVRACWSRTPRHIVPAERTRIAGAGLLDSVAQVVSDALPGGDVVVRVDELGAGRWRAFAYESEAQWPAVCAPFERSKLLLTTERGRRLIATFGGLCAAPSQAAASWQALGAQLEPRAGRTIGAPLCAVHGWLVREWRAARPLTRADRNGDLLGVLGAHVAACASSRLDASEQASAAHRLLEMLRVNAFEGLPARDAARVEQRACEAQRALPRTPRAYGDGRLVPHAWLRCPDGSIVKAGCGGHDFDPTCVGRQAVLWDLAGACVEWRLDARAIDCLCEAYVAAGGEPFAAEALVFYRLAYLAFRFGQLELCRGMTGDECERGRLSRAADELRSQLAAA